MNDLLEKGYAQEVPDDQIGKPGWYLPHHPVIHPQKANNVRVVFDCAVMFQGTSLNKQILQWPDLTNSLIGVLSRFRKETIAVMADVEQMFYQVLAPVEDCNYLRYLWWPQGDLNSAPKEFQMLVHVFGGVSSPSYASFALQRTAEDNQDQFDKEAIEAVRRNFYVDGCLKSVGSEQDAIRLIDQLRHLLAKGGFRLTKWISNSTEVIESVPVSERNSISITCQWNAPLECSGMCNRIYSALRLQ